MSPVWLPPINTRIVLVSIQGQTVIHFGSLANEFFKFSGNDPFKTSRADTPAVSCIMYLQFLRLSHNRAGLSAYILTTSSGVNSCKNFSSTNRFSPHPSFILTITEDLCQKGTSDSHREQVHDWESKTAPSQSPIVPSLYQ